MLGAGKVLGYGGTAVSWTASVHKRRCGRAVSGARSGSAAAAGERPRGASKAADWVMT